MASCVVQRLKKGTGMTKEERDLILSVLHNVGEDLCSIGIVDVVDVVNAIMLVDAAADWIEARDPQQQQAALERIQEAQRKRLL
jgi:hypothetical protein